MIKRNELLSHEETWRKLKCISLSERRLSEKATYIHTYYVQYYVIPMIRHSGKDKTMETARGSVVTSGWGKGGMNMEDFKGSKTILYGTIMVDNSHYTFIQTHRMYNTKSEP